MIWTAVTNEQAAILVGGMADILTKMGMTVLAEGVEDAVHQAFVLDYGCEFIQGYLYAKPMAMDQALKHLLGQEG